VDKSSARNLRNIRLANGFAGIACLSRRCPPRCSAVFAPHSFPLRRKRFDRLSTAIFAGKGKKTGGGICAGSFRKNCDHPMAAMRRIGASDRPHQKSQRNLAENFVRRIATRARPRGTRVCRPDQAQTSLIGRTATIRRTICKIYASVAGVTAIGRRVGRRLAVS